MNTTDAPADGAPPRRPTSPTPARRVATAGNAADVELYGNLDRLPVRFAANVRDPLRFREALSALYAVVGSDYRYVPKDRTAYLAYLRLKRDTAGQSIWKAQQAYFAWLLRNDPLAYCILDPVVTVHPDQVMFEVFGKDESTYACLAFNREAFDNEAGEAACGTTNIDFSAALYDGVQRVRGYKTTRLSVGAEGVAVAAGEREVIEKQIRVPDSWLRGFLQVQSAATLPFDHCRLAPVDVYNLLRTLRMNADQKGKRRGLRFELVPAEPPRLVVEPRETVLPATGDVFRGKAARVVRVWGRRRLMTVRRLLPFVESVDVYLLGSGLPSFWVFHAGDITLTLGLTGFTGSNWSQALGFDLLLPRARTQTPEATKGGRRARRRGVGGGHEDARGANRGEGFGAARNAPARLPAGAADVRHRDRQVPPPPARRRPARPDAASVPQRAREGGVRPDDAPRRGAHRVREPHRRAGAGAGNRRSVGGRGQARLPPADAPRRRGQGESRRCGRCAAFRKQGLKAGPCVHLIALRLAYADREAKRAATDDAVTFETRAFTRRAGGAETVVQVSLERRRLRLRWGEAGRPMRVQALRFNDEAAARGAYFARVTELQAKGYLDAVAE